MTMTLVKSSLPWSLFPKIFLYFSVLPGLFWLEKSPFRDVKVYNLYFFSKAAYVAFFSSIDYIPAATFTVLAKYTYAVEDKGISEIKRLRDLDPIWDT